MKSGINLDLNEIRIQCGCIRTGGLIVRATAVPGSHHHTECLESGAFKTRDMGMPSVPANFTLRPNRDRRHLKHMLFVSFPCFGETEEVFEGIFEEEEISED